MQLDDDDEDFFRKKFRKSSKSHLIAYHASLAVSGNGEGI
jgi:hypothetical protein